MRVLDHPILGKPPKDRKVMIFHDGKPLVAIEGEPILAALIAHGIKKCRSTRKRRDPRWFYCGIGRCTDCVMTVDGVPNIRTCITPAEAGMKIETQVGLGKWSEAADE